MTRTIAAVVVLLIMSLLLGSSFAPVNLWPKASVEKENAILHEENRLLK
jgi:hypothetical protein